MAKRKKGDKCEKKYSDQQIQEAICAVRKGLLFLLYNFKNVYVSFYTYKL